MNRRDAALPWISLIAVYLVWGSTYLGIRLAVATIPPYLMTGIRYLIAGGLLFALQWTFAKGKVRLPDREGWIQLTITAVLLIVIGNGMLCVVETRVESATAALIIATTPIWMLLIDAFIARKVPSLWAICGVALGTAGVAVLVGKGSGHLNALYAGLLVAGSISWAAGSVYARGKDHGPLTPSLEMLAGGVVSTIVALALGEGSTLKPASVAPSSVWGMIWLITAGAMLGYSAFAYAVRTLPTATVATYAYVNPIVAVVLGALLLREPVTWNIAIGGAAVVISVVLILLGNREAATELTVNG